MGRGCDEALFSKKGFFSEKVGGNSVNEGFGKDFYIQERQISEEVRAIQ